MTEESEEKKKKKRKERGKNRIERINLKKGRNSPRSPSLLPYFVFKRDFLLNFDFDFDFNSSSDSAPSSNELYYTSLIYIHPIMRFIGVVLPFLSAAPLISAAPVRNHASDIDQELPDGLPYPSPSELALVEQHAHGTLPNTSPPPVISNKGIVNLQLIAFNELFEVAFFNELVTNITENMGGYRFSDPDDKSLVLASLEAILAVSSSVLVLTFNINGCSMLTGPISCSKKNFMQFVRTMHSLISMSTLSNHVNTFSRSRTSTRPLP